jgi:hypothetical protein
MRDAKQRKQASSISEPELVFDDSGRIITVVQPTKDESLSSTPSPSPSPSEEQEAILDDAAAATRKPTIQPDADKSRPSFQDFVSLHGVSDVVSDDVVSAVQTTDAPFDVDAHLANRLNQLTMEERYRVFHDVHGVSEVHPEEAQVVQDKLNQMEVCLNSHTQISDHTNDAYHRALYLSSTYVQNRDFRLTFLRAVDFDPAAAADLLVRHFYIKLELFGEELLTHDLKLTDLMEEDMGALESGYFQLLPVRDRANRVVYCVLPMLLPQLSHPARVRNTVVALYERTANEDGSRKLISLFRF